MKLLHDGGEARVSGRHFIAADGATSRLRRQLLGPQRRDLVSSYAVRRYVSTQESLEPIFDIYAPVTGWHAGYGWVFPVAERVANVGIGYVTARGLARPPSITGLLDSFLALLQEHRACELGSLEPVGPASGATLGVGFSADRCAHDRVIFVGDAARTCDPITGEGIDQAMRSAHASAVALHRAIKRGTRSDSTGPTIARSNPRLGQDSAMIARLGHEMLKRREATPADGRGDGLGEPTPFFSLVRGALTAEVDHPSMADTPAGYVATALGCADALEALDARLREQVQSEFILCSEVLHRGICAGFGPVGALSVLASHTLYGAPVDAPALDAALAVELLRVFSSLLSLVTPASTDQARANNALAVMIGDYGLSIASAAAARLGAAYTEMLADATEASSEGLALVAQDRFDVGRPVRRYLEWARLANGTSLSFATRASARLAGTGDGHEGLLGRLGESLGIAVQGAEDTIAITRQDPVTGHRPWRMLEEGNFTLPVILAVAERPQLASLLIGKQGARGVGECGRRVAGRTGLGTGGWSLRGILAPRETSRGRARWQGQRAHDPVRPAAAVSRDPPRGTWCGRPRRGLGGESGCALGLVVTHLTTSDRGVVANVC